MAVIETAEKTPWQIEHEYLHSFHDGDIVRWKAEKCFNDYDRSERFICRKPRPDTDGHCLIESIAPEPVSVDCHGHLPCAMTRIEYLEHAEVDIDLMPYRVAVDGCGRTIVNMKENI